MAASPLLVGVDPDTGTSPFSAGLRYHVLVSLYSLSAHRTLAGRDRGMLLTNVSRCDASPPLPFRGVFADDLASSVVGSATAPAFDARCDAIREFSGR